MKQPRTVFRIFLLFCLTLVGLEYLALTRLAPRYVTQLVERAAGSKLIINSTQLSFPLTTTFRGLRLVNNTADSGLGIPRITIWPQWVSLPSRTVWVDTINVYRPFLRLKRLADGSVLRPHLEELVTVDGINQITALASGLPSSWRVHINSVNFEEAAIEFVDEKSDSPFRGVIHHLSVALGPVTIPVSEPLSFAIRGSLAGQQGHEAMFYCSGSWNAAAEDLEAYCRMEPIALAGFLPYFSGKKTQVRAYSMTVDATSRWLARANELEASIQLELGQLKEGDFSVYGRTVVDVQQMTADQPRPTLRGEVKIIGPLMQPGQWQAQFYPGDEPVQRLLERLLEHGVKAIKLPMLGGRIHLVPATKETMGDIEAASREVVDALEILAGPPEPALPAPEAPPAAAAESAPAAAPPSVPTAP